MSRTIKTKETVRDIKVRNPVPTVGRQMKNAASQAKDAAARQLQEPQSSSPNDYAEGVIEEKAKAAAHDVVQTADSQGRKAAKQTYQRMQQKAKKAAEPEALPADSLPKTQQKKKQGNQRRGKGKVDKPATKVNANPNTKQPKRLGRNASPNQKPGRAIGRTQKSAKTAQQTAKKPQQTAKAAAKSAKTAKQTAQRAQQAAQQSVKATKTAVKATYEAIKAAVEGIKALIAAVAAGGWVAVVIILVLCLAGMVLASPMGIFYGDKKTIPQAVTTLSAEFYDGMEVLAVYAVKTNTDPDGDEVVTLGNWKLEKPPN